VGEIVFSRNDNIFAFVHGRNSFQLWDIDMCLCLRILDLKESIWYIVFSPLDRFVLVSSSKHLTTMECHSGTIMAQTAFSIPQLDTSQLSISTPRILARIALSQHEFIDANFEGNVTVWNSEESIEDPDNRHLVQRLCFKAHKVRYSQILYIMFGFIECLRELMFE
jgi:hypothetical protein